MCAIRNPENSRRVLLTGTHRLTEATLHPQTPRYHDSTPPCVGRGMGMRVGTGISALGDLTAQLKRQSDALHLLLQAQHEAGTWQGSDHLRRIDVLGQSGGCEKD